VEQIHNYFETPQKKNTNIPQNIREKFCPAVGNIGVISVSQQMPPYFGFVFVGRVSRDLKNYFRGSSTQKKNREGSPI
jgi:hypothetical protein